MKLLFLFFIKFYRKFISPNLMPRCRFYPTCSEYSYNVISKYGIFKGVWLSIVRIGKCHPFHEGGYDPVK